MLTDGMGTSEKLTASFKKPPISISLTGTFTRPMACSILFVGELSATKIAAIPNTRRIGAAMGIDAGSAWYTSVRIGSANAQMPNPAGKAIIEVTRHTDSIFFCSILRFCEVHAVVTDGRALTPKVVVSAGIRLKSVTDIL